MNKSLIVLITAGSLLAGAVLAEANYNRLNNFNRLIPQSKSLTASGLDNLSGPSLPPRHLRGDPNPPSPFISPYYTGVIHHATPGRPGDTAIPASWWQSLLGIRPTPPLISPAPSNDRVINYDPTRPPRCPGCLVTPIAPTAFNSMPPTAPSPARIPPPTYSRDLNGNSIWAPNLNFSNCMISVGDLPYCMGTYGGLTSAEKYATCMNVSIYLSPPLTDAACSNASGFMDAPFPGPTR